MVTTTRKQFNYFKKVYLEYLKLIGIFRDVKPVFLHTDDYPPKGSKSCRNVSGKWQAATYFRYLRKSKPPYEYELYVILRKTMPHLDEVTNFELEHWATHEYSHTIVYLLGLLGLSVLDTSNKSMGDNFRKIEEDVADKLAGAFVNFNYRKLLKENQQESVPYNEFLSGGDIHE
jgi:hypothetical protein